MKETCVFECKCKVGKKKVVLVHDNNRKGNESYTFGKTPLVIRCNCMQKR